MWNLHIHAHILTYIWQLRKTASFSKFQSLYGHLFSKTTELPNESQERKSHSFSTESQRNQFHMVSIQLTMRHCARFGCKTHTPPHTHIHPPRAEYGWVCCICQSQTEQRALTWMHILIATAHRVPSHSSCSSSPAYFNSSIYFLGNELIRIFVWHNTAGFPSQASHLQMKTWGGMSPASQGREVALKGNRMMEVNTRCLALPFTDDKQKAEEVGTQNSHN